MKEYIVKFITKDKYKPMERNIIVQTPGTHMDAAGLIYQQFGSSKHITLQTSTDTETKDVFDFMNNKVISNNNEDSQVEEMENNYVENN